MSTSEHRAARLLAHPLLADLADADRRAALRDATFEDVAPGQWLLREGQTSSSVVLVLDGEIDVVQRGRLVALASGPRALELASALRGLPAKASYRAEGPVLVARLAPPQLLAAPGFARALAEEIDELQHAREEAVVATDDFFLPGAVLVPGPYRFGPFGAHFMVVESERARLAAQLPPGLSLLPGSGGRYLVAVTRIEEARVEHTREARRYGYHEATPFLPCIGPRGTGLFTPELYPSSVMAVLLGREIYGFPKRLARAFPREDGIDFVVDDRRLLRARWSAPRPLELAELGERMGAELFPGVFDLPGLRSITRGLGSAFGPRPGTIASLPEALRTASVFVRKRILHEASEIVPRFSVDALVEVPFVVDHASEAAAHPSFDVRFAPEHPVLHGEVRAVFSARLGFAFGAGIMRRDYLARGVAALFGRGARGSTERGS